jgi:hypothetical protein
MLTTRCLSKGKFCILTVVYSFQGALLHCLACSNGRHDTQHYNIRHNDSQHIDTQHINSQQYGAQYCYALGCNAECRLF